MNEDAYDLPTFCRINKISRATFYNLKKRGQAPRFMKVGALIRITPQAAEEWRREREAASCQGEAA